MNILLIHNRLKFNFNLVPIEFEKILLMLTDETKQDKYEWVQLTFASMTYPWLNRVGAPGSNAISLRKVDRMSLKRPRAARRLASCGLRIQGSSWEKSTSNEPGSSDWRNRFSITCSIAISSWLATRLASTIDDSSTAKLHNCVYIHALNWS